MPGQAGVEARAQGVTLIMVQKEKSFLGWTEIGKTSGHCSATFNKLMGVSEMHISVSPEMRRTQSHLSSTDAHAINGQREENI